MEKLITVLSLIAPILVSVYLGMIARKKMLITADGVQGLQRLVLQIFLPCVIFNSVLTAKVGAESLSVMGLLFPFVLGTTLWAFRFGKKKYPYHNLPMMFSAQESGMLGMPLFMVLFGNAQLYHMVILDLTQAVVANPTVAILSADTGENPNPWRILKKVLTSPLVVMCLLALGLNLTGAGNWLNQIGIGRIIT